MTAARRSSEIVTRLQRLRGFPGRETRAGACRASEFGGSRERRARGYWYGPVTDPQPRRTSRSGEPVWREAGDDRPPGAVWRIGDPAVGFSVGHRDW